MSDEILSLKRLNVDIVKNFKYQVYDRNGSTSFTISSGSFDLKRKSDGVSVDSGSVTPNNSDTDNSGNTIKTITFQVDTGITDISTGPHNLDLLVELDTGETKRFLVPVEIVDIREI